MFPELLFGFKKDILPVRSHVRGGLLQHFTRGLIITNSNPGFARTSLGVVSMIPTRAAIPISVQCIIQGSVVEPDVFEDGGITYILRGVVTHVWSLGARVGRIHHVDSFLESRHGLFGNPRTFSCSRKFEGADGTTRPLLGEFAIAPRGGRGRRGGNCVEEE